MNLEKFFSVSDVVARFHPSRSARWVKQTFRNGDYGPVLRCEGGWQVSERALLAFQTRHAVGSRGVRTDQVANLVQFQKSSRV